MVATNVILPALGMSQDVGKIVRWLKAEGEQVIRGEPLVEIETDKATVEIEAPSDGVLAHILAAVGDSMPVGHVIATILASEETLTAHEAAQQVLPRTPTEPAKNRAERTFSANSKETEPLNRSALASSAETANQVVIVASALAARIAAEHGLDLSRVQPKGKRVQKSDVLRYLKGQSFSVPEKAAPRLVMASPKARRLAAEQGKDLGTIKGTGPAGAILAVDVLKASSMPARQEIAPIPLSEPLDSTALQKSAGSQSPQGPLEHAHESDSSLDMGAQTPTAEEVGNVWRIMAERTTGSWTQVPHFYLVREINASRLIDWRERLLRLSDVRITYTDLLVKSVAAALRQYPRLNGSWSEGRLVRKQDIHIGLAVAVEGGLVVPVIHRADVISLGEIARQRRELIARAQSGKLRPSDISDGTFTISNLGMYGVDAFNAIINQPQAAILAAGRIAERVVPLHGQPVVQPMMVLTLSCDHRAVDGARAAQFLATLTEMLEDPLALFNGIVL